MIIAGCVLIYLAIAKEYEPVLLLPIGMGCIIANIPMTGMNGPDGLFTVLYDAGIKTELFPLIIFIGVGAMIDFSPLLSQPKMVLLGAAGQFGIFGTLILATLLGFPLNEAASIGVIGAIDGPTSIFVASKLAPNLLAPIAVAAYSYMSLIPIIQPPIMKADDHKARAPDAHGIRAAPHLQRRVGRLPDRRDARRGHHHPGGRAADQHVDAGQSAARKRRGRSVE